MNTTFQKVSITLLMAGIISLSSFSQVRPYVNASGRYDLNLNKYYDGNDYTKIEGRKDYGASLSVGTTLGKRLRFYVAGEYMYYTYGEDPANEDLFYSEANMTIQALNFSPAFDCRFFTLKKFDLYAGAGYRYEWIFSADGEAKLADGWSTDHNFVDPGMKKSTGGFFGSLMGKYNINKHLGVKLECDYTYFLNELYYQNNGRFQRLSAGLGLEYVFMTGRVSKKDSKWKPGTAIE